MTPGARKIAIIAIAVALVLFVLKIAHWRIINEVPAHAAVTAQAPSPNGYTELVALANCVQDKQFIRAGGEEFVAVNHFFVTPVFVQKLLDENKEVLSSIGPAMNEPIAVPVVSEYPLHPTMWGQKTILTNLILLKALSQIQEQQWNSAMSTLLNSYELDSKWQVGNLSDDLAARHNEEACCDAGGQVICKHLTSAQAAAAYARLYGLYHEQPTPLHMLNDDLARQRAGMLRMFHDSSWRRSWPTHLAMNITYEESQPATWRRAALYCYSDQTFLNLFDEVATRTRNLVSTGNFEGTTIPSVDTVSAVATQRFDEDAPQVLYNRQGWIEGLLSMLKQRAASSADAK